MRPKRLASAVRRWPVSSSDSVKDAGIEQAEGEQGAAEQPRGREDRDRERDLQDHERFGGLDRSP